MRGEPPHISSNLPLCHVNYHKALLQWQRAMSKNVTFHHFINFTQMQNTEMRKSQKVKMKNVVKILRLTPPMSFSALKPGPVVPPGIEKVPNQAARISQSVDFTHLSDILTFLRGYQFLTLFITFSLFTFIHFSVFAFSDFVTFVTFSVLMILSLFLIL